MQCLYAIGSSFYIIEHKKTSFSLRAITANEIGNRCTGPASSTRGMPPISPQAPVLFVPVLRASRREDDCGPFGSLICKTEYSSRATSCVRHSPAITKKNFLIAPLFYGINYFYRQELTPDCVQKPPNYAPCFRFLQAQAIFFAIFDNFGKNLFCRFFIRFLYACIRDIPTSR